MIIYCDVGYINLSSSEKCYSCNNTIKGCRDPFDGISVNGTYTKDRSIGGACYVCILKWRLSLSEYECANLSFSCRKSKLKHPMVYYSNEEKHSASWYAQETKITARIKMHTGWLAFSVVVLAIYAMACQQSNDSHL